MTGPMLVSENFVHELSELKRQVQILVDAGVAQPPGRIILRQHLGKVAGTAIPKVTSGSPDTAGSETVTLYKKNDNDELVSITDGNGDDITVEVFSFASAASGTDSYVWVGQDNLGTWWYLNEACP